MQFADIIYEIRNGVAWIIINRPEKMNAFRGTTCDELIRALSRMRRCSSVRIMPPSALARGHALYTPWTPMGESRYAAANAVIERKP